MKKILVLIGLIGMPAFAVNQPQSIGNATATKLALTQNTLAQIQAFTPDTTGQIVLCTNCVESALCISTGILSSQWAVISSTGATAWPQPCK